MRSLPTARNFDELRDHIHKVEFLPGINEYILFKAHMLDNGIKRIFAPNFPWDLQADAIQLWHRWCSKNFNVNLLRGLIVGKGTNGKRTVDRVDPAWKSKYNTTPKFYGQGDFVLGQWWPNQISLLRDGAHGSVQGGIFGEKEKGAYSVVLSGGNHYGDIDNGDDVWYSGTDGSDFRPTENTQRMIESQNSHPVRVFRSSNLHKKNKYRPERGFRYDGLYTVVEYNVVDRERAIFLFHLIRCAGQNPIRYEIDKPSSRPTRWEIEAYDEQVAIREFERPPQNS